MKKILILVGDGMGDYPVPALGNRTPLQAAAVPNMRRVAGAGEARLLSTVPDGMAPGSDVANVSLMGLDPRRYYTGRAPIEAAGAGIPMRENDVAFRCNLVTVTDGIIRDHSAGHISTDEARPIMDSLQADLGNEQRRFFISSGYRHLLLWENGPTAMEGVPPHDVLGRSVAGLMPRGPGSDQAIALMEASKAILAEHPSNLRRRVAGLPEATQIWLWGQGKRAVLPNFQETFGLGGGMISAVDLLKGIGRLCGLEAVRLQHATGYLDTDYAEKVQAALQTLKRHDFAFVHVEAPDECSHAGKLELKIQAIEAFDREVVGPAWRGLQETGVPYRLIICTDHRTPVSIRNHTSEPIPVAVLDGPLPELPLREAPFDESVNNGKGTGLAFEWIAQKLKERA